jgi:type IV pilus assembly protein PilQ
MAQGSDWRDPTTRQGGGGGCWRGLSARGFTPRLVAPRGLSALGPSLVGLSPLVLAALSLIGPAGAAFAQSGMAPPAAGAPSGTWVRAADAGQLEMKLRRTSDAVEVVIAGVGAAPQLLQTTRGSTWEGRLLVSTPTTLRQGPQRLTLPEAGLQMVSIDGAGSRYALMVTPVAGYPLGRPVVSADGSNLILSFAAVPQQSRQTYSSNLSVPGSVPYPESVPPLQPRAVAPPLGDMAVGTMVLRNSGFVNASGPPVSMTLNNAPAPAALMSLARMGGYGFVYVNDSTTQASQASGNAGSGTGTGASGAAAASATRPNTVSVSFRNENYARALNSTLLAAGLQGKLEGNTLLVGTSVLGKSFGAQLSKVYRLNQVSANSAAAYLANLGAQVTTTNTITTSVTQGATQSQAVATSPSSATTQSTTTTTVEAYGASTGPLLGLQATTDSRLSTITLVGSPAVVAVAEQYLKQLDLRQRQVALSVKILDVTLDNNTTIDNSFAFRFGNNFILNQSGTLVAQFGRDQPTLGTNPTGSITTTSVTTNNAGGDTSTSTQAGSNTTVNLSSSDFSNLTDGQITTINNALNQQVPGVSIYNPTSRTFTFTPSPGIDPTANNATLANTLASNLESTISRITGLDRRQIDTSVVSSGSSSFANNRTTTTTTSTNTTPIGGSSGSPADKFVNYLRAVIVSSSTKVLASPTLILSENSEELRKGDDQSAVLQTSGGSSGSGGSGGGGASSLATIGRTKANEAFVTVGEQVVTSYDVQAGQNGAPNSCQPQFGIAGLTFGARVSKIDDNGFVTFSMSPAITASVRSVPIQGCGPIDVLAIRRLDTGSARVRDGQTLILTGVISDRDTQEVLKWPILGDIPIIGQFFRASDGRRAKRELVILVTPRIIDDTQGGGWGYGYQPASRDTQRFLR